MMNIKKDKKNFIKYLILAIALCIIIYVINYLYKKSQIEKFTNPEYDILISNWDNGSGFYSQLLFKLNHYLYCKKII
jgi:hypothetical protein